MLWLPVVGSGPLSERVFGQGFLWRPNQEEEALLRADWEELSDLLALGAHWEVDARRGRVLQLRPKGAHGASLRWTLGEEGDWVQAQPRGFYLRAGFTTSLIQARLLA